MSRRESSRQRSTGEFTYCDVGISAKCSHYRTECTSWLFEWVEHISAKKGSVICIAYIFKSLVRFYLFSKIDASFFPFFRTEKPSCNR